MFLTELKCLQGGPILQWGSTWGAGGGPQRHCPWLVAGLGMRKAARQSVPENGTPGLKS